MPLGSQATKNQQGKVPTDTVGLKKRISEAKVDADKAKQVVYDIGKKGKLGGFDNVYKTENALNSKLDSLKKARKP